jgi:hypothetical protein
VKHKCKVFFKISSHSRELYYLIQFSLNLWFSVNKKSCPKTRTSNAHFMQEALLFFPFNSHNNFIHAYLANSKCVDGCSCLGCDTIIKPSCP